MEITEALAECGSPLTIDRCRTLAPSDTLYFKGAHSWRAIKILTVEWHSYSNSFLVNRDSDPHYINNNSVFRYMLS